MKVERTEGSEKPKFRELKHGDVFLFTPTGSPCLRCNDIGSESNGSLKNCVNLLDGLHRYVDPDTVIIPQPHAKLVI